MSSEHGAQGASPRSADASRRLTRHVPKKVLRCTQNAGALSDCAQTIAPTLRSFVLVPNMITVPPPGSPNFCRSWADFGRRLNRARLASGRLRVKADPSGPNLAQTGSTSARERSEVAGSGPNLATPCRLRPQFWPESTQRWSMSGKCWQTSPEFAPNWPKLVGARRNSVQLQPEFGPSSAPIRPTSARHRPSWAQVRPKFAQCWHIALPSENRLCVCLEGFALMGGRKSGRIGRRDGSSRQGAP